MRRLFLAPLIVFIYLLASCTQKTDSSLTIFDENYPQLDFKINNGAPSTNNLDVTINYTSTRSDVTEMSITEGEECRDSEWLQALSDRPFTLSASDGLKKISVKIKTIYGFKSACVTKPITLDRTAPQILALNHQGQKDYFLGDSVSFKLQFNEPVTVIGTPRLILSVEGTARNCYYVSGSGSSILTFRYDVQFQDEDINGIDINPNLEVPIGSVIFDMSSNAVQNSFPSTLQEPLGFLKISDQSVNTVYVANGDRIIPKTDAKIIESFTIALTDPQPVDVQVTYALIKDPRANAANSHTLPQKGTVNIPANARHAKLVFEFDGNSNPGLDQTVGIQLLSTNNSIILVAGRTTGMIYFQDSKSTGSIFKELSSGEGYTCGITPGWCS